MAAPKPDKEGELEVYTKDKFKAKFVTLSGGSLLLSKKKGADEFDTAVALKGGAVKEGGTVEDKKKKALFTVTSGGTDHIFAAKDDKEVKSWVEAIKGNLTKEEVAVTLAKKKQSAMMSIKKNVSGKAATSGAGKGLIKDELGKNGVRVIDIMKEIITMYEGKKKATEIEDNIIRFAVKIILLWKNKDLSTQELMKTLPYLRAVWSNLIDFCEMSFAYEPAVLAKNSNELVDCFVKLIQQHVTDKTIEMVRETLTYLSNEKLMDILFKDPKGEEYKKELEGIVRGAWIKLFKDAKK
jgi:hypothetical protein